MKPKLMMAVSAFAALACGYASAQTSICTPDSFGRLVCSQETKQPDAVDKMISEMQPTCLSKNDSLGEAMLAFGQPVAGGNGAALANAARVANARREKCAAFEAEAARQAALARETANAEAARAALQRQQLQIFQAQQAAQERAAQAKAAEGARAAKSEALWMADVSNAVIEGRCKDATEIALRQSRLDVADQAMRLCKSRTLPPTSTKPHIRVTAARSTNPPAAAKAAVPPLSAQDEFELGLAYETGRLGGTGQPDKTAAALWYRKAADHGHGQARISLARLMSQGDQWTVNSPASAPSRASLGRVLCADGFLEESRAEPPFCVAHGGAVGLR